MKEHTKQGKSSHPLAACLGLVLLTDPTAYLQMHNQKEQLQENLVHSRLHLKTRTASFHVKVPPRHNGVFQVNVHGDTKGTHIISANSQFLEKNPNVFQHEISIVSEDQSSSFPLVAVTNLDFAKTLHIGKGEIIGFARPESEEVLYIATTEEVGMDPYVDNAPRNWVPPRKRKTLNQDSKTLTEEKCKGLLDESMKSRIQ